MNAITSLLDRLYGNPSPSREDVREVLTCTDDIKLLDIFAFADSVRKKHVGDGILLRGIVEFSNFCRNTCAYCGINRNNAKLERYRLTREEILESVSMIAGCGIRTVVLQSGEDSGIDAAWLADIIRSVKERHDMAVTLSVGEWDADVYRFWREAGADRYLLKIETTDPALYGTLHPGMSLENRLRCLNDLQAMGYQTGSGIIAGLKGQTYDSIVEDIFFLRDRNFDMIGIGPFIPHGETPLRNEETGSVSLTLKIVALLRILSPTANLPATTALGSVDGKDFRLRGLQAGANVLMPNFTPVPYRRQYEIYPGKRCVEEPQGSCASCMESMAGSIGRHIDYSIGNRK